MSISVAILGDNKGIHYNQLCTEKEFREFRRWINSFGKFPKLNSFPLRYTGKDYLVSFSYYRENSKVLQDEGLADLLHELVSIAEITEEDAIPSIYNYIIYLLLDLGTRALQQNKNLVFY